MVLDGAVRTESRRVGGGGYKPLIGHINVTSTDSNLWQGVGGIGFL